MTTHNGMNRRKMLQWASIGALSLALPPLARRAYGAADTMRITYQRNNNITYMARERGEFAKRLAQRGFGVEWVGPFPNHAPALQAVVMSKQRVFLFDEVDPVPRALPNGDQMLRRPYIEHGAPLASGSALAASGVNRLDPGSALPWHEHRDDEEAHVFISGRGFYLDKDRVRHPIKAGDIAFCLKGEGHGVENPGPDPLLWGAIIVGL